MSTAVATPATSSGASVRRAGPLARRQRTAISASAATASAAEAKLATRKAVSYGPGSVTPVMRLGTHRQLVTSSGGRSSSRASAVTDWAANAPIGDPARGRLAQARRA